MLLAQRTTHDPHIWSPSREILTCTNTLLVAEEKKNSFSNGEQVSLEVSVYAL